ncbi:U-box domain-containing protein 34 [Phtheirospermum japonicum]|uniref:RING-type E3 ubiquitin transferase n=1 Tax=Phtheirospermum japonicum TaxID=374723 RepID=A0A830BC68_9LAMI|nr:U-box domain-containing protein 34 [Phtheirospermum japonicum]
MWLPSTKGSGTLGRRGGRNGLVAVAIDKDKGSQNALKWASENLLTRGQTVVLIHVVHRSSSSSVDGYNYAVHDLNGATNAHKKVLEKHTKELFLTFHCFCTRKDIHCLDVLLEDTDIAKAITEYVAHTAIENLVLGSSHHGFINRRLKTVDIPASVSKAAPDFCTIYVISKTKISSVKNASRLAPFVSPLINQIQQIEDQANNGSASLSETLAKRTPSLLRGGDKTPHRAAVDDTDFVRSPFSRGRGYNAKMFGDLLESDTDISFVSSDRPSTDRVSGVLFDSIDSCRTSRVSTSSESSFGSMRSGTKGSELSSFTDFSSSSIESFGHLRILQEDAAAEMRRLKLELQRTMEMYSTACKAALTAEQKTTELHRWRKEEERRLEEARIAEESARLTAEREKAKYKAAMENAQAAQRVAEIESQKRVSAEMKAIEESDEKEKDLTLSSSLRYRRYAIDEIEVATEYFAEARKVGEGGYGPVFKCYLDHTPVAVKVLRPDAAQGRSQFNKEVEVLSCMRHPNMVLLLGACPEYGCLVYEYMSNGSLEDRLCRQGNTRALSWQLRFRIAAEIATGLHFLHQTKPEPLVHRDLKPGNILLDQNYVSKISDVGLARLVPPSAADDMTQQYRMTSTAGTFCYIDPEYQQTGMLGVKSDVYSFGIILLQLLTAKPAMGLTHHVEGAIEEGTLKEVLDPNVPDWPMEEAMALAKLALQCAELRRKDRPDLGKVVLPELSRLRDVGEESMGQFLVGASTAPSPVHSSVSTDNKVSESKDFKN